MAGDDGNRPIIKKVKKVSGEGHHGGAWKVAYADFVTAMMAFFLMMWLLNATTEEQRKGIADYFNPRIPLARDSGGGESFFLGENVFATKLLPREDIGGAKPPTREQTSDNDEREDIVAEKRDPTSGAADESGEDQVEAQANDPRQAGQLAGEGDGKEAEEHGQTTQEAYTADSRDQIEEALDALKREGATNELLNHISLRMTPEGLVIEIADRDGAPLFQKGSANPSDKLDELMEAIAPIVASVENKIAVVGHTDATPFASARDYSNWELSSDRANAARRLLNRYGLDNERIRRVSGSADRDPLTDDAFAAQNRRIGVVLLRREQL